MSKETVILEDIPVYSNLKILEKVTKIFLNYLIFYTVYSIKQFIKPKVCFKTFTVYEYIYGNVHSIVIVSYS